jgi:hypothetical protein
MVLTEPQKIETPAPTKGTLKGLLWGQMPANLPRIHERQEPEICPLHIKACEKRQNATPATAFFALPIHEQHGPSLLRHLFRSCESILATYRKTALDFMWPDEPASYDDHHRIAAGAPNGYYAAPILILCQYSAIQTRLLYKRPSKPFDLLGLKLYFPF